MRSKLGKKDGDNDSLSNFSGINGAFGSVFTTNNKIRGDSNTKSGFMMGKEVERENSRARNSSS